MPLGPHQVTVSGHYVRTDELVNSSYVYRNASRGNMWLCKDVKGRWWVQQSSDKGQAKGFAYCREVVQVPWEASTWNVSIGLEWELQRTVRVEAAGTATEEVAWAVEQTRQHASILRVAVGGIQGPHQFAVEGHFILCAETIHGAPVYRNTTNPSMWLCRDLKGRWWIQPTEFKGNHSGFVYCSEIVSVPWEGVTWNVSMGLEWEIVRSVCVEAAGVVIDEPQSSVCSRCSGAGGGSSPSRRHRRSRQSTDHSLRDVENVYNSSKSNHESNQRGSLELGPWKKKGMGLSSDFEEPMEPFDRVDILDRQRQQGDPPEHLH